MDQVQWKAESKTLRWACKFHREHSQEKHQERIRQVDLGREMSCDGIIVEPSADPTESWAGSSELSQLKQFGQAFVCLRY